MNPLETMRYGFRKKMLVYRIKNDKCSDKTHRMVAIGGGH